MSDFKEPSKDGSNSGSKPHVDNDERWRDTTSYRLNRVEFLIVIIFLHHFITTLSAAISSKHTLKMDMDELYMNKFEERIMRKVHKYSTQIVSTKPKLSEESLRTKTYQSHPPSDPRPIKEKTEPPSFLLPESTPSQKHKHKQKDKHKHKHHQGSNVGKVRKVSTTNSNFDHIVDVDVNVNVNVNPRSRWLQVENNNNNTSCTGTSFYLELRLDECPAETSWELMDDKTNAIVANQSFKEREKWLFHKFTTCLDPGPYVFSLFDSFGDGIRCDGFSDGLGCYEIYLDDELALEGPKFYGKQVKHSFDSTLTYCKASTMFLVEVKLEANLQNHDWHLRHDVSSKPIKLELIPDMGTNTNTSAFYFSCLIPGVYIFDTSEVNSPTVSCEMFNDCFIVTLDGSQLFQQRNISETSMYSFSISQSHHGRVNERHCHQLPSLSPFNLVKGFQYDDRTEKIMSIIYAVSSPDFLNKYDSFQYKAACWLIFDDELQITAEDAHLVERYVTAVFLYAVKQNAELLLTNNTCDFSEIVCNARGHIKELNIRKNFFKGTIPSELSYLHFLEHLNLGYNHLTGTIPPELGRLSELIELRFNDNHLTGTIPSQFGSLHNLNLIWLQRNKLEGNLPPEIGNCEHLIQLTVSSNNIGGTIPVELFHCTKLEAGLWLYNNSFTGTIPTNIYQLQDLRQLELHDNKLSGSIPSEIGGLSLLRELYLHSNELRDQLPEEVGNLTSLEKLDLHDNLFTGTLPSSLENFVQSHTLELINFGHNKFTGQIPSSLWNITSLKHLDLKINDLTGSVPDHFCDYNLETFLMDDLLWFHDEPKVNCMCCNKPVSCYIWNTSLEEEEHSHCPHDNHISFEFYDQITIIETTTNIEYSQNFDDTFRKLDTCFSPLGCYKIDYKRNPEEPNSIEFPFETFNLSYSISSNSLFRHDGCDTVQICGTSFNSTHPQRETLNHIAQLAIPELTVLEDPSSPVYKALCWIITEDPLLDRFHICDGTLLQRYVLALLHFSVHGAIEFNDFASDHTCEWTGIKCDPRKKFVEHIDLSNNELNGALITEIGLLSRLQTINFAGNNLDGTLNPIMFHDLEDLMMFDVSQNQLSGEISEELFELPKLKRLHLANNLLIGTLPDGIVYTKSLEYFDVGNNLLQGKLPRSLFDCDKLEIIVLSRNGLADSIPTEIGNLKNLRELKFDQNLFFGSIPFHLFDALDLQVLMLQSNRLTGSIPIQVGNLKAATHILLNHNLLKGTVPTELEDLKKLEYLHLHRNRLTGTAPLIEFEFKFTNDNERMNNYIADCGDPSYLLPALLECDKCTICCNSEDKCQKKSTWRMSVVTIVALFTITLPIGISTIFYLTKNVTRFHLFSYFDNLRDPVNVYSDDSVYCFILSRNPLAWLIYLMTSGIQIRLFVTFIEASSSMNEFSDNSFPIICPHNSMECENADENVVALNGWFLFFVVMTVYLGTDILMSILQIRTGVNLLDLQVLFSGLCLLGLTSLTFLSSFIYNLAFVERNADLVINAVILLFINDLDEKVMCVLHVMFPEWTGRKVEEIAEKMRKKNATSDIDI